MELWMKSTQPAHDSPSARTSPPLPPEPSISSPERHQYQEAMGFNFEDFHGGGEASDSLAVSIEKLRTNVANDEIPVDILMGELRANLRNHPGLSVIGANFSTPANDGGEVRTIPSFESGHGIPPLHAEVNPGRSNKKRLYSSSRHSGSSLEPVAEEPTRQFTEPNFKISRLSENELLVETGPTQTQQPIISEPDEKITVEINTTLALTIKQQRHHVGTTNLGVKGMITKKRQLGDTCKQASSSSGNLRVIKKSRHQVQRYQDIMVKRYYGQAISLKRYHGQAISSCDIIKTSCGIIKASSDINIHALITKKSTS